MKKLAVSREQTGTYELAPRKFSKFKHSETSENGPSQIKLKLFSSLIFVQRRKSDFITI